MYGRQTPGENFWDLQILPMEYQVFPLLINQSSIDQKTDQNLESQIEKSQTKSFCTWFSDLLHSAKKCLGIALLRNWTTLVTVPALCLVVNLVALACAEVFKVEIWAEQIHV